MAESTRQGGVSPAPYHSLNLGLHTADNPAFVTENRRRFAEALGFSPAQMAYSHQVHGADIWQTDTAGGVEGCDALITNQPDIFLCVSTADCTPILVYDARQRAVAAVHAGWRGTVAGLVSKTLAQMAATYGTRGADCWAYVGTCISAAHFEVGDEVAAHFSDTVKHWNPAARKYHVDLKKANQMLLEAFGIPQEQIEVSPFCTIAHNGQYFSHRAEGGVTGRMVSVVGTRRDK